MSSNIRTAGNAASAANSQGVRMRLLSSVLFAFVVAGCGNAVAPPSTSDLITARAANNAVEITNNSSEPVHYIIADKESLALIDLYICVDPAREGCTSVSPGSTKRIEYSKFLAEGSTGSIAVVYHWRLIPAGQGAYKYDLLRQLEVNLR